MQVLGKALRRILFQERLAAVTRQSLKIDSYMSAGRIHDAYAILRRLRPYCAGSKRHRPPQVPMVLLEDGAMAATATEAADRWLEYFGGLEAASVGSLGDVFGALEDRRTRSAEHRRRTLQFSLDTLPTIGELEGTFRSLKGGKAPGLDGLLSDVFRAAPTEMAGIVHPLMVKVGLRIAEPVVFMGGRLA